MENKKNKIFTVEFLVSLLTIMTGLFIGIIADSIYVFYYAIMMIILGFASKTVGDAKGINASCFYWGWLFGIIGLIVVCGLPNRLEVRTSIVENGKYNELDKILSLKERGALTQEEFDIEKQKILSK